MPPNTSAPVKPGTKPGANPKGKPLGIGKWGWIAAIAVGLIIGYFLIKKNNSSAATTTDSGTNSTSPQNSDSGTGGGVVASPPPDMSQLLAELAAMGLIHGGSSNPSAVQNSNTDQAQSASSDFVDTSNTDTSVSNAPIGTPYTGPAYGSGTPEAVTTPSGGVTPVAQSTGSDYVQFTFNPTVESPASSLAGGAVSYQTAINSITGSGTLTDPSGHVVNAKGARVGGVADPV